MNKTNVYLPVILKTSRWLNNFLLRSYGNVSNLFGSFALNKQQLKSFRPSDKATTGFLSMTSNGLLYALTGQSASSSRNKADL
jgi:hypothetical protein